jgi:hypothetical protein
MDDVTNVFLIGAIPATIVAIGFGFFMLKQYIDIKVLDVLRSMNVSDEDLYRAVDSKTDSISRDIDALSARTDTLINDEIRELRRALESQEENFYRELEKLKDFIDYESQFE